MAHGGFGPTAFAAAGLIVWIAVLVGLAIGVLPRSEISGAADRHRARAGGPGGADGAFARLGERRRRRVRRRRPHPRLPRRLRLRGARLAAWRGPPVARRAGDRPRRDRARSRSWPASSPGPSAIPMPTSPETLPAALGRLTYPVGYWNGLAAVMAAAIVLCSWFAAAARGPRARALAVGALPPVLLALWMTDSRGGLVAAALAFVVLLLAGRGAGADGRQPGPRRDRGGDPDRDRRGLRHDPQRPAGRRRPGRRDARDHACGHRRDRGRPLRPRRAPAAVRDLARRRAVRGRRHDRRPDRCRDRDQPGPAVRRVQGAADRPGAGRRFGRPAARGRQRPLPVLGDGGERVRERPGRRGRRQRLHARTGSSIATSRSRHSARTRCCSRPWPSSGSSASRCCWRSSAPRWSPGSGALGRRAAVAEVAPALALLVVGLAAAAVDWTWDLPAVFVSTILAAALLTGPATLSGPDPGPAAARGGAQPAALRRRRRPAARRLGFDLRVRAC